VLLKIFCVALAVFIANPLTHAEVLSFDQARQRADNGDAFAQAVVALHYQLGWKAQKNTELAARYALASANAKHPLGLFRLGALMRTGEGLLKDEQKGLSLQSAAFNALYNAQDPYSISSAAIMIFQGKVVGQNVSEDKRHRDAVALYKKAAEMGYAPAQFNYAMALIEGHGVAKDDESSKKLLSEALWSDYPPAQKFVLEKDKSRTKSSASEQSMVEGVSHEGQRWTYEFVEHENEPTTTLANDSAGLVLYADNKFVIRAAELQGTARNAKTELSFYDAQTCRLLSVVSVPNRIFAIKALRDFREGVFCLGTITPAKYRYDDFPLALVLVDIRARAIERLPLVSEDYWLALNNNVLINTSGSSIRITVPSGLAPNYLFPSPLRKEFRDVQVKISEGNFTDKTGDYEGNRKRHLAIVDQDSAALAYLGSAATAAIDPARSRGQFATGRSMVVRTSDAGRLSVINFGRLSSNTYNLKTKGAFLPHVFKDGGIACITGEGLTILNNGKLSRVGLPAPEGNALPRQIRARDIFESPLSPQEWNQRIMFTENEVGYSHGDLFFRFNLSSDGFEQVSLSSGVKSQLQRYEDNEIRDWDLASGTFVMFQNGTGKPVDLPFYQRFSAKTGEPVGEGWDGGGKVVYNGMAYSKVSNGWRAISFVNGADTGGVSSCVVIEKSEDGSKSLFVAGNLPSNAKPLALRVEGSRADVFYGAGDSLALDSIDLSSGQVQRKQTWTYASRFGEALFDDESGRLFMPTASGFEVWNIFGSAVIAKQFDLILGEDEQYAILLPNGAYAGSPGCENLLSLNIGEAKVDAVSVAPWRNRPVEVLKALAGNTNQIDVLAKVTERWQKRIGFDPAKPEPKASDLPKVLVTNRPALWSKSAQAQFPIEWQQGDSPVSKVIVRVNGVDCSRFEGKMLENPKKLGYVDAVVKLVEGQNWIEVVAIDEKGLSSNLVRFRTILSEAAKPTKRYIIAMGVSKYRDSALNLEFAAKDATDLASAIKESTNGETEVLLLTDEQATKDATAKIREFLANATENDEVVAFCAGHGVLDSNLDYVYASHEFDSANPSETGIKLDELVDAIGSSKSLKRLLLLDTCHSGQVGEKDEMLLAQMNTELPKGVRAVKQRGMSVKPVADLSAEGQQRFIEEMFLLPGIHRGINIIGASGGAEFALESAQWNNGVFTATIIEALRDKKADLNGDTRISVVELRDFLGQRVSELTKGAQKPSVVASERDQDFDLIRAAYKRPAPPAEKTASQTESAAPTENSHEGLQEFFNSWMSAHQSNSPDALVAHYADQVAYCYEKGITTRAKIREGVARLMTGFPARNYTDLVIEGSEPDGDGGIKIHYSYRYAYTGKKNVSGQADVFITVQRINGDWKITRFDEKTGKK